VAVKEPTCTGTGVTEVGHHSSFSPPFTFPSFEESQVPIYCWVNRESFGKKIPCSSEPKTFSTSVEHSNHSATAPLSYTANRLRLVIATGAGNKPLVMHSVYNKIILSRILSEKSLCTHLFSVSISYTLVSHPQLPISPRAQALVIVCITPADVMLNTKDFSLLSIMANNAHVTAQQTTSTAQHN